MEVPPPRSKEEAGTKPASSLQTLLSTALVALSNLSGDATRRLVFSICSPLVALGIAWALQQLYNWYLQDHFRREIKAELQELTTELHDAATDPARKALIPAEIAELRKLRQKRFLKMLEIIQ